MPDSKNSYKQKVWEHAVTSHARFTQYLINYPKNKSITDWAIKEIQELETKFPQLKKEY